MSKMAARPAVRSDSRRSLAVAIWTATTVVAVVIISRRVGGHFVAALDPISATLATGFLAAINVTAALLLTSSAGTQRHSSLGGRVRPVVIGLLTTCPPMAFGMALLPSDSMGGLSAVITVAMFCGLSVLLAVGGHGRRLKNAPQLDPRAASSKAGPPQAFQSTEILTVSDDDEFEFDNPQHSETQAVSQSMSRSTGADGSETIEGTMLLPFAAGQQIAVGHLAFSPLLSGQPEVSCHLLVDRPVRLRVTTAQSYGVRLEAKRTETTSVEEDVLIGYMITADNRHTNAA